MDALEDARQFEAFERRVTKAWPRYQRQMEEILEEFVFNQLPVPMPLRGSAPDGQAELANNQYDVVRLLSEPLFPLMSTMSDLLDSEADNIIEASPRHALLFINEGEVLRILKTEIKSPTKLANLQRSETISSTASSNNRYDQQQSAATSLEEKSFGTLSSPRELSRSTSAATTATPMTSVDSYSLPPSFPSSNDAFITKETLSSSFPTPSPSTTTNSSAGGSPRPRALNLGDRIWQKNKKLDLNGRGYWHTFTIWRRTFNWYWFWRFFSFHWRRKLAHHLHYL